MTTPDLEAELAAHEQAAIEAQALAAQLEADIIAGKPDITVEQIEAQEKLARFANLRVEATKARLEEARKAAHLAAIRAVRDEIETAKLKDADHYVGLLRAVEDAALAWAEAAEARGNQLREWRRRLYALGVEEMKPEWTTPPADQCGIAPYKTGSSGGTGTIRVGDVTIGAFDASWFLTKLSSLPLHALREPSHRPDDLYGILRRQVSYSKAAAAPAKKSPAIRQA